MVEEGAKEKDEQTSDPGRYKQYFVLDYIYTCMLYYR